MASNDYQPDYTRYRPKGISIDRLDQLAGFVFEGNAPSYWGALIAAIKLSVAIAYLIARKMLVDSEMLIEKQQYEQDEHRKTDDDLDRDDLDTQKK